MLQGTSQPSQEMWLYSQSVSATTALRVDIGAFNEQLQEAINKALEIDAIMLIGNST